MYCSFRGSAHFNIKYNALKKITFENHSMVLPISKAQN